MSSQQSAASGQQSVGAIREPPSPRYSALSTSHEREALLRQVARLDALHRIHHAAAATLELDPMLETVVTTVTDVMGSDACGVYLYDAERELLVLSAVTGLPRDTIGRVMLRIGEGIPGRAARERTIVGSSRVDLQACKLEYSIVSPK